MRDEDTSRPEVITLTLLAGIMMILSGIFHAQEGAIALLDGSFYALTPNYAFGLDVTAWGLLLGLLVAVAGGAGPHRPPLLSTSFVKLRWIAYRSAVFTLIR